MIAAIRQIPSRATARSRSTHDPFPARRPTASRSRPRSTSIPNAAMIEVDLRDNPDCLPCGLNLSEACARTAAMVGIFNSIDHGVPKNAGSFRRLRVHLRENCIVGIPRHPTSCSVATTNLADRVANCVQAAIAEHGRRHRPGRMRGDHPARGGRDFGRDPATARRFVNQVFLGLSGGPGAPGTDAWQTICAMSAMPACASSTASSSTSCASRSTSTRAASCRTPKAPGGTAGAQQRPGRVRAARLRHRHRLCAATAPINAPQGRARRPRRRAGAADPGERATARRRHCPAARRC